MAAAVTGRVRGGTPPYSCRCQPRRQSAGDSDPAAAFAAPLQSATFPVATAVQETRCYSDSDWKPLDPPPGLAEELHTPPWPTGHHRPLPAARCSPVLVTIRPELDSTQPFHALCAFHPCPTLARSPLRVARLLLSLSLLSVQGFMGLLAGALRTSSPGRDLHGPLVPQSSRTDSHLWPCQARRSRLRRLAWTFRP